MKRNIISRDILQSIFLLREKFQLNFPSPKTSSGKNFYQNYREIAFLNA